MASIQQLAAGTRNMALSTGWPYQKAQLEAGGFQLPAGEALSGPDALRQNSVFNGGVSARIDARLEKGDQVFRLSRGGPDRSLAQHASGVWWFDEECYRTLRHLSGPRAEDFRRTAQTLLALSPDWKNDMATLVTGTLRHPVWCIKGLSAPVETANHKMVGRFTLDVLQIFVPGGLTLDDLDRASDQVFSRLFN